MKRKVLMRWNNSRVGSGPTALNSKGKMWHDFYTYFVHRTWNPATSRHRVCWNGTLSGLIN